MTTETIGLIHVCLKKACREALSEIGISPENYILDKLLSVTEERNMLIRQEFSELVTQKVPLQQIFTLLATKHKLKVSHIRQVSYKQK